MSLEDDLASAQNVVVAPNQQAVGDLLRSSLRNAASRFEELPSVDNWTTLQGTMYAWQFWQGRSSKGRQRLAEELWPVGIGSWVSRLAAKVGKRTED